MNRMIRCGDYIIDRRWQDTNCTRVHQGGSCLRSDSRDQLLVFDPIVTSQPVLP